MTAQAGRIFNGFYVLASFDKRRIVIIAGVAQTNAAQKLLPFDN